MAGVRDSIGRFGGRLATIALLLIVWLGVAVIGAGPSADSSTWVGIPSFDWLNYVFAALMVLGAIIVIISLLSMRTGDDLAPPKRRPLWPILLVALLFVLLIRRGPPEPEGATLDPLPPIEAEESEPVFNTDGGGGIGRSELLVLAAILGAAVGAIVLSRRTPTATDSEEEDATLERALGPALGRAAEQLLDETDPRSAVLLAYRSLEAALEDHGLPRDEAETPAEHLTRALVDLPLDTEPLITLSELYLQARYSTGPITVEDQRSAAASLERVRRQLPTPPQVDDDVRHPNLSEAEDRGR